MSLISFAKSLVWPNPTADLSRKAAPISTELIGPLGQRNADWTGIQTAERVRDMWGKCATAFACLTLLADAVAESPLRVYRTNDEGDPEEQPAHRARVLLANPTPARSEAEFMVLTVLTMGLHGYAAVEKVRSGANIPVELWPLRPDWLKRERASDGSLRWMYRRPGTDPREIAADDLIIIPYYHDPSYTNLGLSPLHIVAREAGIDVALTDLLKVFIDNGGIPPWAVEIPDSNPNQAEVDAFREKWAQTFAGIEAYRKMAVLYGGMKLVKIGDSIGDMAWPDLRSLTELKICQAFRVPANLVQARESLNGGSLTSTETDGDMTYLQNHGAQPLRMRIDGAFTRGLLADFGADSRLSLEFDTSGILALQEDRDALHTRVRADWQAGLITLNEARTETSRADLGKPGDVFMQAFTTMLVPISELASAPDPSPAITAPKATMRELPAGKAQRVYRDLKALSAGELEVRANTLATVQRERQRLSEIGARALRKFFKAQGERIVGAMPKSAPGTRSGPWRAIVKDGVVYWDHWVEPNKHDVKADTINWDEEARRLWDEVMSKFYGSVGDAAFSHVSATVGTTISWDLANPNIGRIMDELGKRIVDISETTRQDVIKVITDGQADGLNLQQIADNLTGMFEDSYRGRAMTVARTETMISWGHASVLGWKESGVVDSVEIQDNPDHTEPYEGAADGLTCAERDQLVVPLDQAMFHIESDHPNGSAVAIPIIKPLGEV